MKKRENKKNRKNRLLLLILLLILTVSIGVVGTYAWFTSNKVVDVTDLQVDVRTVNGLEISYNAESWGVRLTKDNLIAGYTGDVNQLPNILTAVSTAGNVGQVNVAGDGEPEQLQTTGRMDMFVGSVVTACADGTVIVPGSTTTCDSGVKDYLLTTTKARNESKCYGEEPGLTCNDNYYYMAFDLFLKYDGAERTKLFLSPNSDVKYASKGDKGVQNAARVAFLVQGNITAEQYYNGVEVEGEGEDNLVDGKEYIRGLNGATNDDVYIWEPNYDTHTDSGVIAANRYYNIATQNKADALSYSGVLTEFDNTKKVFLDKTSAPENSDYFRIVQPDILTKAGNKEQVETGFDINPGVTKIRVYYWVEGQDVDAENDASGSDMKLNLEFMIE